MTPTIFWFNLFAFGVVMTLVSINTIAFSLSIRENPPSVFQAHIENCTAVVDVKSVYTVKNCTTIEINCLPNHPDKLCDPRQNMLWSLSYMFLTLLWTFGINTPYGHHFGIPIHFWNMAVHTVVFLTQLAVVFSTMSQLICIQKLQDVYYEPAGIVPGIDADMMCRDTSSGVPQYTPRYHAHIAAMVLQLILTMHMAIFDVYNYKKGERMSEQAYIVELENRA